VLQNSPTSINNFKNFPPDPLHRGEVRGDTGREGGRGKGKEGE